MVLFLLSVWLFLQPAPVRADSYTFTPHGSLPERWDTWTSSLPEAWQEPVRQLGAGEAGAADVWQEPLHTGYWLHLLTEALREQVPGFLPVFAPLFTLLFLTAGMQAVLPDTPGLQQSCIRFSQLAAAVTVFRMMDAAVGETQAYLQRLCGLMNTFLPVMESVALLSGRVHEKNVACGSVLFLLTLLGYINAHLLLPLLSLLVTGSAAAACCPDAGIGGAVQGIRRFVLRIWAILGMLFSFLLGMQTMLARAADNLGVRTARFALGSFIPMAGGMLAEAYTAVQAGLGFIRQAAGLGGILVLLLFLLPGMVPLWLYQMLFSLVTSAADILDVPSLGGLFRDARSMVDFLLAVVLMSALLFLFALVLFMKAEVLA